MTGKLKSCGVFIVRHQPRTQFLLMKHPSRWDIPKGHVDKGETDRQCALRELWEETGISADDIRIDESFLYETEYKVRSKRTKGQLWDKTLVVFLAELIRDAKIKCTEHDSYEWFDWEPPHQVQAQAIDPLLEHIQQHWIQHQGIQQQGNS
jgi:8-oxo-dGTP pyrophosphatase MutT (NUDIX family)